MAGGTSVHRDALLLAVVVLLAIGLAGATAAVRALLPVRPQLPQDDRPPAGLGRLVPVGSQVDAECRRGVLALEAWLASRRRGT